MDDGKETPRLAPFMVGAAVLMALAAGFLMIRSADPSPAPAPAPLPVASDTTAEAPATPAPVESEDTAAAPPEQELWFVQEERLSWGSTVLGGHPVMAPVEERARYWLGLLLAGPTGPDQEVGATTAIPEGTELLGVELQGDVLFVDLTSEFESGGGSLSMQLRVAQVVYTATQFEGVERVRILIDGEEVEAIGGEGLIVAEPLSRRDFQDHAPNVVVENPRASQVFSPGDTVSGFANVFEANVSINVVDANGKTLVETFTTATCGSGCWGDFSEAIRFRLNEAQQGRVNVLTYSAEDGSPQDVISIPVFLVP